MLDEWELLSSMQALLIYMILRLQEGESMYNNFDVLLLSAMWVSQFQITVPGEPLTELSGCCMRPKSQNREF
jgi:hypothetical protein